MGGRMPDTLNSPPAPPSRVSNLPVLLTRFIGRERESVQVKQLLSTTRLLTLTGSGGCGKTRLALQVAAGLEQFPDGVWLVDLAPLVDPLLVPQTVAALFGLHESGAPLVNLLQACFRAKNALWILDNCEHLIQACAEFAHAMLLACPDLKILATSREPLNVPGEITFRVPSLEIPDLQRLPDLESLVRCESIQLFVERAQAARPAFQLTAANALVIAQICHRLDGMPLAIELAAAHVNAFSTEEIAARLDDRFRLLNSGTRTSLPRHRTLRASIDWSYNLLSVPEQVLLQELSVFAGGFPLEAVERVCAQGQATEILSVLSRLVRKSLVIAQLDGEPRYRLLETIRQYAREKLAESGNGDVVRDRHLDYFIGFAQRTTPRLHGPEQRQALEQLDGENDNLRTALEWSLGDGRVERGLGLAGSLAWYWDRRGFFSEGRARVESLLGQPSASPNTLARAEALVAVGLLANSAAEAWVGGARASRPYLEQALSIARAFGPAGKRLCALALAFLSNNVRIEDPKLAQSQYDEAWAIARELDEPWMCALLLHQRAHWFEKQDDIKSANKAFQESMELFTQAGDKHWAAILLGDIADYLHTRQGDYRRAREIHTQNLAYFRETRDRMFICFSLMGLGAIARLEGNPQAAQGYYAEGLDIARELGSKLLLGGAAYNMGFLAVHAGEFASARSFFADSLVTMRELKADVRVAHALAGFGCLAAAEKQARRAARIFAAMDTFLGARTLATLNLANEADYQRYLAIARQQLAGPDFRAAWSEGCSMTKAQAIEYALAEPAADQQAEASRPTNPGQFGGLTPREREVALLVAQGKTNPEIAQALVVSERTVTTHVTHILSKLGFTSRTQIAAWAATQRLIQA